jgi:predicted RNase H-like HicB family nuclease
MAPPTNKQMTTNTQRHPSPAEVEKMQRIYVAKGARPAAFSVLRGACTLATKGLLSLSDLPDLPCVMNAADEIEDIFSAGVTAETLAEARAQADEAIAELLAEEGIEPEGAE